MEQKLFFFGFMDSPSHVFDDGHKTFSPTYIENMVNMPRIGWILGQTEPFFVV